MHGISDGRAGAGLPFHRNRGREGHSEKNLPFGNVSKDLGIHV